MPRVKFPKNSGIAVIASLTIHCVVVVVYCLMFDCSLTLKKSQQVPKMTLIWSYLSEEGRTLPSVSAAKQTAVMTVEEKRDAGEIFNLQKGKTYEALKEKVASLFVKSTGDVAGGMAAGGKLFSSGNTQGTGGGAAPTGVARGMASAGEMSSPGYANVGMPAGGSLSIAAPRYSENSLPIYPLPARRRGYAGVVMLSVEVLTDGSVGRLEMKKSSGYEMLDRAALDAVKSWKFSPAKKAGAPIIMWVDVPVRFALN